jgi:hypothetical protein
MGDTDPAILAGWREITEAADPGPWVVSANHGVDIADEGWSEVRIVTEGGASVAMTFLSHVLEPARDDENGAFIVTARTAMPRLVAAVEAVLAHHIEAVIYGTPAPFHYCKTCSSHPAWPCPEVRDVRAALTGKEASDGK